jgi:hypothetical protein
MRDSDVQAPVGADLHGYTDGGVNANALSPCKQAIKRAGDPPPANVWLDAKSGALAIKIELPHVTAACKDVVVIPVAQLRAMGAQPDLVKALIAAHTSSRRSAKRTKVFCFFSSEKKSLSS